MVLMFAAVGVAGTLWTRGGVATALSCLGAAGIFSALPESWLREWDKLLGADARSTPAPAPRFSALERTAHRLEEQARAYDCLWEHISQSLEEDSAGEESGVVFQRTMERVCTGCFLAQVCWKRDYDLTCRDLTQVLETMQQQGGARPKDYPEGFRRRCDRMEEFVRVANEELFGHWARQRSRERLRENRGAVCSQYAQLSRLLNSAAAGIREEVEEDSTGAASARRALEQQGIEARCALQVDRRGRRTLEVRGRGLKGLRGEEGSRLLSGALGVRMEPGESFRVRQGEQLVFHQCPPLSATVAVASRRRREGQANGDNGLWFRDEEGVLWVALCDGMGSGSAAAKDSRLLAELLKDFLLPGVGPAAALSTLSGALGLAGEVDGGFTTVDLLGLDLFSGAVELYKMGGAPTYLRRGGLVGRVVATALPAGLEGGTAPDETRFRLAAEDFVVLVTDGVTDGQEDAWLRSALEHYNGESARELAQLVLSSPAAGREDDRTVVALRLTKRLPG
jgi:stage II sporulation protein E